MAPTQRGKTNSRRTVNGAQYQSAERGDEQVDLDNAAKQSNEI